MLLYVSVKMAAGYDTLKQIGDGLTETAEHLYDDVTEATYSALGSIDKASGYTVSALMLGSLAATGCGHDFEKDGEFYIDADTNGVPEMKVEFDKYKHPVTGAGEDIQDVAYRLHPRTALHNEENDRSNRSERIRLQIAFRPDGNGVLFDSTYDSVSLNDVDDDGDLEISAGRYPGRNNIFHIEDDVVVAKEPASHDDITNELFEHDVDGEYIEPADTLKAPFKSP